MWHKSALFAARLHGFRTTSGGRLNERLWFYCFTNLCKVLFTVSAT